MSEDLKKALLEICESMDIPLVGVASVERWNSPPFLPWMPEEFYPQSIYPEARSVIVIGLPIPLPVLETSPSIYYRELYNTVNALLDQYTYRLANFLTDRGTHLFSCQETDTGTLRYSWRILLHSFLTGMPLCLPVSEPLG